MNLSGILPAVVTPLDENERFIPESFEKLLERVYSAGAHGVYVSGNTGEGLLQPIADRERLIEAAVKNSPADKTVIAHVGANRTADVIRLATCASRLGVAAVSSLPPIGSYSFQETKIFYEQLAAASGVPVLVYYYPEFSRAIASLDAQRELMAIPNVAGIKFTDFDLYSLSRLKKDGAVVFNGHDEVLAAGLLMGADGGIGSFYNLVPELFVEVFDQSRAGNWSAARAAQEKINNLIEIVLRFPMLPAIKRMLDWEGIPCGPCFEPRRALTTDEESQLREMLSETKT